MGALEDTYTITVVLDLILPVSQSSWSPTLLKCWFALNCEWKEPATSSQGKLRHKGNTHTETRSDNLKA